MITKENLLDMLKNSLANEDEFVVSYGNDLLFKIDATEEMSVEERDKIKTLLYSLISDTERHAKVIKNLIEKIEKSNRDEF